MPGFGSVATPDFSGGDRTAPRRASSLRRFSQELTPRGERTPRSSSVRRSPDQRSHSAPRGGKGIVGERRGSRDLSPAPARKVTPREFFIAQEARCSMHPLPVKSGKLVVRTPLENPLVAGDSSSDQPRAAGFSVAQERALQEQRELPDAAAIAAAEAAATRFRGFSAKSLRRHDGQAVKNIFAAWEQENEPPQQAQECGQHMDVTLKGAAGRTVQVSIPGRPRPQYVLQTLADGIMPAYEPDVARDCYRVPGHLRHCVVDADGEWNDLTPRERSSSVQAQNRNRRSEDVRAALSGHAEAVAESQSLDAARREARMRAAVEAARSGREEDEVSARKARDVSPAHRFFTDNVPQWFGSTKKPGLCAPAVDASPGFTVEPEARRGKRFSHPHYHTNLVSSGCLTAHLDMYPTDVPTPRRLRTPSRSPRPAPEAGRALSHITGDEVRALRERRKAEEPAFREACERGQRCAQDTFRAAGMIHASINRRTSSEVARHLRWDD
eukprot:TRINITY_DN17769_c0_g1_i1.p1 TRINITY_DN17769_c0_g1~~TRINITY_DN17769_c0_g1_i1.p1  ORF type:complete len:535 (+),score=78.12 TRINITY_DN17769_c0_g1_i1:113-1606(+)